MTGLELTHLAIDNADQLRTARGISVAELARAAGISRAYYYLLKSVHGQDRVISLDVLARIATALDIPPGELLRGGHV